MKKLIITLFLVCFVTCGFFSHKTIWASGDHFWFSAWGYKSATIYDYIHSQEEGWWGDVVIVKDYE
jgi:hypothetical protein